MSNPNHNPPWVTFADVNYPVYALWFSSSQRFVNNLTFQSVDIERTS